LALSVFSKDILLLFSKNPEYLESYRYIPFMLLAFCFQGQQYVFTIGLHYVKKISSLVWITLSTAILNLFLNWLLLPRYGLYGSVIAVNISSFLMSYLTYYMAQRKYRIPYEMGKIILIFLAGFAIYAVSMAIPDERISVSIILKILLILSFPFLLYLMRFYDVIELQSIRKIWSTWKDPRHWKKNIRRIMGEGMNDEFM
jgi:peptidoglycan biosynthesis protein MviN/MurJ (putative lipid II flippase)